MAEEEWYEPESLVENIPSDILSTGYLEGRLGSGSCCKRMFFDGDDKFKYGTWMFEVFRGRSKSGKTERFIYELSHLASCRMKILETTMETRPNKSVGTKTHNLVVGPGSHPTSLRRLDDNYGLRSVEIRITFQKSKNCPCSACRPLAASSAYEEFFFSSDLTDVVFQVGDDEIKAHKALLSARYDYFKALFASGCQETQTNRVVIKDVDADKFREVLRFIYSAKVPANFESDAATYLQIADKYGFEDLKNACSNALKKSLAIENVTEILPLAEMYQCPDLVESCLEWKNLRVWKNAIEYLMLAHKYQRQELNQKCFEYIEMSVRNGRIDLGELIPLLTDPTLKAGVSNILRKCLTDDNFTEILSFAETHQCQDLIIESCVQGIESFPIESFPIASFSKKKECITRNVSKILTLAQKHRLRDLKEKCIRLVERLSIEGEIDMGELRPLLRDSEPTAEASSKGLEKSPE